MRVRFIRNNSITINKVDDDAVFSTSPTCMNSTEHINSNRRLVFFFRVSPRRNLLFFIAAPRWMCLPNEFNQSKGNRWTVVSFLYIVIRINGFLDNRLRTLWFWWSRGSVCHGLRSIQKRIGVSGVRQFYTFKSQTIS